jgi:hypothetical protein
MQKPEINSMDMEMANIEIVVKLLSFMQLNISMLLGRHLRRHDIFTCSDRTRHGTLISSSFTNQKEPIYRNKSR